MKPVANTSGIDAIIFDSGNVCGTVLSGATV